MTHLKKSFLLISTKDFVAVSYILFFFHSLSYTSEIVQKSSWLKMTEFKTVKVVKALLFNHDSLKRKITLAIDIMLAEKSFKKLYFVKQDNLINKGFSTGRLDKFKNKQSL